MGDAAGSITGIARSNGVSTSYGYDALDRLISVRHERNGTAQASFEYTLDNAGNKTGVAEADGARTAWTYDAANRLIAEEMQNAAGAITYNAAFEYDPAGNRTLLVENGVRTQYAYNQLDQLTESIVESNSATTSYAYDGRGNLTRKDEDGRQTAYEWDADNRLAAAELPDGGRVEYAYDFEGRRVRQASGMQTTNYLWDETSPYGDVVYEADGNGDPLATYGLVNGALITQARNEETSFYLADGQGSVRGLVDASGQLADEYQYSAYGALLTHTGANENPYLYTGQQYDAATALYSLRARYYAPEAGRFLSRDTHPLDAADPVEWNRYGYTAGNPVNRVDPSGMMAEIALRYKTISMPAPAIATTGVAIATKYILIYLVFTMPIFMLFADVISAALPDTDVDAPPTEADLWRQLWPNAKIGIDTYTNIKPEPKQKPDPKQATIVPPFISTPEPTRDNRIVVSHYTSRSNASIIMSNMAILPSRERGAVYALIGRATRQRALLAGARSAEARIVFLASRNEIMPDPEILDRRNQGYPEDQIVQEAVVFLLPGPVRLDGRNPVLELL